MIKKIGKDYKDNLDTGFSISWHHPLPLASCAVAKTQATEAATRRHHRNPFIVLSASKQVLCALRDSLWSLCPFFQVTKSTKKTQRTQSKPSQVVSTTHQPLIGKLSTTINFKQ